jgi:hypothetical protein
MLLKGVSSLRFACACEVLSTWDDIFEGIGSRSKSNPDLCQHCNELKQRETYSLAQRLISFW